MRVNVQLDAPMRTRYHRSKVPAFTAMVFAAGQIWPEARGANRVQIALHTLTISDFAVCRSQSNLDYLDAASACKLHQVALIALGYSRMLSVLANGPSWPKPSEAGQSECQGRSGSGSAHEEAGKSAGPEIKQIKERKACQLNTWYFRFLSAVRCMFQNYVSFIVSHCHSLLA